MAREAGAAPPVDEPALPAGPALERAQELLNAGRAFAAHEVLEAVWKSTEGAERALWRGLAQLCVALTHFQRGNLTGARALLRRAAETLAEAPAGHGVRPDVLAAWAERAAAERETPTPPRLVEG
jgi:predicted metal-dependent hydrolase